MTDQQLSVELFPAGNGDAMLIRAAGEAILIDGGYVSTYRDHLKSRLMEMHTNGERLSLFVVTHIDADHISGAIAFLKDNGPADRPNVIGVDEIWFNSYRHLHFEDKERGELLESPEISLNGGMVSEESESPESMVSFGQGSTLGSQILKYGYNWNTAFRGNAVASRAEPFPLGEHMRISVLGPGPEALDTLASGWFRDLRKRYGGAINEDAFFDDAFELLVEEIRQAEEALKPTLPAEEMVSFTADWVRDNEREWLPSDEDDSATNGSSITLMLECIGKRLFFLGDAIPGQVVEQLRTRFPEARWPMHADVIKVAHHGAFPNNSPELLRMLTADHYLFSSNGLRHHHPHLATLSSLLTSTDQQSMRQLIFNYRQQDRLGVLDNPDLMQQYNYSVRFPKQGEDGYVRLVI